MTFESEIIERTGLNSKLIKKARAGLTKGVDYADDNGRVVYTKNGERRLLEALGVAGDAVPEGAEKTVRGMIQASDVVTLKIVKLFPNHKFIEATENGVPHLVRVFDARLYIGVKEITVRHCLNMWFEMRRPRRKGVVR